MGRARMPIVAGEHVHVHGGEHDHAVSGTGPAASPVFTVPSADAQVIGTAETRSFVLSVRAAASHETDGRVTAMLRNDELGLADYGLEYIHPEIVVHMPFADGSYLTQYHDIDRTCDELAKFSKKDAAAYRRTLVHMLATVDRQR